MTASRKKSRKQKLLLVLFGALCGLLLTEVFLRVTGYSAPLFYGPDYYCGIALRPNISGAYQREGRNYVSINSGGLRDLDHSNNKASDPIRIGFAGNSVCQ